MSLFVLNQENGGRSQDQKSSHQGKPNPGIEITAAGRHTKVGRIGHTVSDFAHQIGAGVVVVDAVGSVYLVINDFLLRHHHWHGDGNGFRQQSHAIHRIGFGDSVGVRH